MRYHWSLKLLALILAAVSGAGLIISGLGVAVNLGCGYYESSEPRSQRERQLEQSLNDYAYTAAITAASQYELDQVELGLKRIWKENFNWGQADNSYWPECEYTVRDEQDSTVLFTNVKQDETYARELQREVSCETGRITRLGGSGQYPEMEELTPGYVWTDDRGNELEGLDARTITYELYEDGTGIYRVERFDNSVYQVHIFLTESDLAFFEDQIAIGIAEQLCYDYRNELVWAAAVSALVLLGCVVYLCFAAGHKSGSGELAPGGLNRLPLDVYVFAAICGETGLICLLIDSLESLVFIQENLPFRLMLALSVGAAGMAVLVAVLVLTALCAQVKAKTWLTNSVIGRVLGWALRLLKRILVWLKNKLGGQGSLFASLSRKIRELYGMLPLVWQWVAVSMVMFILLACCGPFVGRGLGLLYWLVVAFCLIVIIYAANYFGKLRDAAKKMAQGDLDSKLDTAGMEGCFREFGEHLNMLGDVCMESARKQMKSERMKSELITNVSHDIKTPLTSIINYVDLLQRAETEQQRQEYLEVLNRQSQKLKKLIDDLMELSKASSGNVTVELAKTDVTEAVTQALGEYADTMDSRGLHVVVHKPEAPVLAMCDGKLLWRVLANVLGNVVKYSLPNTRVYVDVEQKESRVCLSVKNISREELNISSEELMERFVRGDESRNTEGSGLGLNIAKGLMEAQGGKLDLVVDGDLFKVILTLNGV